VEKFKNLEALLTSFRRPNKEINTQIRNVNAIERELYRSLSQNRSYQPAGILVSESFFARVLTYRHESWVITERVLSQVQTAGKGFLPSVHGVRHCHKVRSCEIRRALTVEPLLRIEKSQLRWFRSVVILVLKSGRVLQVQGKK